jgi:predicted DNA-binding transcriptional regulator YafY
MVLLSAATGSELRPLRLPRIVDLLRVQPLPAEILLPQLNHSLRENGIPEISLRTLQHDLEWLLANLGNAGIERVTRAALKDLPPEFHRYRLFYRLIGAEDLIPVTGELIFITEMEALALVTAKALLTTPATPGTNESDAGPLADAVNSLLGRLGLDVKDNRVPDILAVTQAAPQPYDPAFILSILRCIRVGDAIQMQYGSLNKEAHEVIAQPVRLVLVDGEPYLWAWDDEAQKLKNYKVARITALSRHDSLSDGPSGLAAEVRGMIKDGFRGVSGAEQRGRVVLRVSAAGVPHLRHRRLGGSQKWQDLPDGGARVEFNTSGMDAVRHWLLQFGSAAVVESPRTLVEWFRVETAKMAAAYSLRSPS